MPCATSACSSVRTRAAIGFCSAGSSSVAISCTARSNSAICARKASRKKPETRSVTSTRGRSSRPSGRISMPVTRCEGRPTRARAEQSGAWARSSPPVRMFAVPQAERRTRPVAVLLDVALDQQRRRFPAQMPGGRGRHGARVDREELRPVGSTSGRPRLGAPLGPGSTKRPPARAARIGSRPARSPEAPGAGGARPARALPGSRSIRVQARGIADQMARQQLEALDSVAMGAPSARAHALQRSWLRADPGLRHRAVQRVEACQAQIGGERPEQRCIAALAGTRGTLTSAIKRSVSWSPAGLPRTRAAVADLQFLELAQVVVELAQGVFRASAAPMPMSLSSPSRTAPGSRRADRPRGAGRARPPRSIHRPGARARTRGRRSRRASAAASGDRRSRRPPGASPARPRPGR